MLAAACHPVRKLPDNQYLLVKNTVVFDQSAALKSGELEKYILQEPNKRFLVFWNVNLWVHNETANWRPTRFRNWVRRMSGPPPAIFDPVLMDASVRNIRNYLNNKGYFDAAITPEAILRNKKVFAEYRISLPKPYTIRDFSTESGDSLVGQTARSIMTDSPLRPGQKYDFYVLEQERERFAREMRNRGFFYFTNDFVVYEVDSAIGRRQLDIRMLIRDPRVFVGIEDEKEIYRNIRHNRYTIRRLDVLPQFSMTSGIAITDTLQFDRSKLHDSTLTGMMQILYSGRLKINPRTLARSIYICPGRPYNLRDVDLTYRSLAELPGYRYINIDFAERDTTGISKTRQGYLDCSIQLSRGALQSYSIESEATNTGGDLGLSGSLVYENRNIFRGAEMLRIKLRGAAEAQKAFEKDVQRKLFLFNTYEMGAEFSLTFPRFIGPVRQERFPSHLRPKTSLGGGFNYQDRPDYRRYVSNAAFTYRLKVSDFKQHFFTPLEINAIKIYTSEAFQQVIDSIADQGIRNQYSNHLIPALKYSYIFSNQELGRVRNFKYFRLNFESAGNALFLIDELVNAPLNSDGDYSLFGIRYAQYVKSSLDLRHYIMRNATNSIAFRVFAGFALPYGNSDYLPFERGFFAGGANGMRGWNLRALGPGRFDGSGRRAYDRMGDIQLEANVEYRFQIYNSFRGAFFADAGNIWLIRDNPLYPGGLFSLGRFYKEIALDAGIGLRLDFTYFVFRLDAAMPLLDPAYPEGSRWMLGGARFTDLVWNFGIGYPF